MQEEKFEESNENTKIEESNQIHDQIEDYSK